MFDAYETGQGLPVEILLQRATAMKAALALLLLEEGELTKSLRDLEEQTKKLDPDYTSTFTSHLFHLKKQKTKREESIKEIAEATKRLDALRVETVKLLGKDIAANALAYEAALADVDPNGSEQEKFTQVAGGLLNKGTLSTGSVVIVAHDDKMKRAKVVKDLGDNQYKVSLWKAHEGQGRTYAEGFDTETAEYATYERSAMYPEAKAQKQSQPAKPTSCRKDYAVSELGYLLGTYADAERSNQLLITLGPQIADSVNSELGAADAVVAMNAPLKRMQRVFEKVAEKYKGDFSKVCDIARMTFACRDFAAASRTLQAIHAANELEPLLMKNRLMVAFDPAVAGGYRDCLLNCRDKSTGHIVEVQITLKGLLDVKANSGHSQYKLVRTLELNEEHVTKYIGAVDSDMIKKVKCGLLKKVRCKSGGLAKHIDEFRAALESPTCMLTSLIVCEQPFGGTQLSDLLSPKALEQLAPRLTYLSLNGFRDHITGPIPEGIWECTRLTGLCMCRSSFTGTISPQVGQLTKLIELWMWDTKIEGDIPKEISNCKLLRGCALHAPHTFEFQCRDGVWHIRGTARPDLKDAEEAFKAYHPSK